MKVTPAIAIITLALFVLLVFSLDTSAQKGPAEPSTTRINPLLQRVVQDANSTDPSTATAASATTAPVQTEPARRLPSSVRTADFYLKDGTLIFGKVIEDDRNKITVERLEGSSLVAVTYSRKQIEPRSIQIKNVPTAKFYADRGDYFAGNTWDFKDDPDDFILAIRSYEQAKLAVDTSSPLGAEKAKEIAGKIGALQDDRKVWAREIEGRAKLKELEFQAEYVSRFKEMQDQIEAGNKSLSASIARLEETINTSEEGRQTLEQNFMTLDQDVRQQLAMMADQIDATRRMIDPFYRPPVYRQPYRRY